jgi:micrococcal nuclease
MRWYQYKILTIIKVVDGDTVWMIVDLGFNVQFKLKVRLVGIDTPEISFADAEEKARGEAARVWLAERLSSTEPLTLRSERELKDDKYGRCLGRIFVGETDINSEMVHLGIAKWYTGGARE